MPTPRNLFIAMVPHKENTHIHINSLQKDCLQRGSSHFLHRLSRRAVRGVGVEVEAEDEVEGKVENEDEGRDQLRMRLRIWRSENALI
jgi:hypothetical protein